MQRKKIEIQQNYFKDADNFEENFFSNKLKVHKIQMHELFYISQLENMVFQNPWSYFDFNAFYHSSIFRCIKMVNTIVGYAIYRKEYFREYDRKICHLMKIAVHPEFRNLGIGSILLKQMEKYSKRNHLSLIYLEVRESNKSAISFYEKNGYFRYKVIDDYYQETGESAFLMVKNIKKIMKI